MVYLHLNHLYFLYSHEVNDSLMFQVESGYGTSSDSSSNGGGLRRHGSVTSLQSTGSHG